MAIAVFDRGASKNVALASEAATAFANKRVDVKYFLHQDSLALPSWTYLDIKRHPASSTNVRNGVYKK